MMDTKGLWRNSFNHSQSLEILEIVDHYVCTFRKMLTRAVNIISDFSIRYMPLINILKFVLWLRSDLLESYMNCLWCLYR